MTSPDADAELGWGVGSVAARLGIAASTLRTWERRYDVGPSRRTAGGHRRYTETDIDRVLLTQLLIARGAPPSDAARVAHSLDAAGLAGALATENGPDVSDPAEPADMVKALLDSARGDDQRRVGRLVADALRTRGLVVAWTEIVAPALVQIGNEWSAGRFSLEAEHMASEAIVGELRAYTRGLGDVDRDGPTIVLASAEDDQHSLPVFALESALAERGVGSHVLGSQMPAQSLVSIAARIRPRVVFLWASLTRSDQEPMWEVLRAMDGATTVILGGPGWPHEIGLRMGMRSALESADLPSTVQRILDLVAADSALPAGNLEA